MSRTTEHYKIVPVIEAKDYGSAGIVADSINSGKAHQISFLLTFGAITGNSILTVNSGASAATKTTAETFWYRLGGADYKVDGADGYGNWTSSAALTLTAATYDHRSLIIEVDPSTLTADQPWVTLDIDATATVMLVGGHAIVVPRYASHSAATVI